MLILTLTLTFTSTLTLTITLTYSCDRTVPTACLLKSMVSINGFASGAKSGWARHGAATNIFRTSKLNY